MKKRIFLPVFLSLAILTIGILATKVKAQEQRNYPPIVQKISDRFNLNVSDVEEVFDEEWDARRADRYAHFAERLNDLVEEQKLSEDQKNAILEKHEQMGDQIDDLNGLTFEQRRTQMQKIHEEFLTWAEEQNIDLIQMRPFNKGFGVGMGYMMNNL